MGPETFLEEIKKACGADLLSFVIYGSAAAGDAVPGRSDINVMLILREVMPHQLRAVGMASRGWIKAGNPPPLMFTPERLRLSADTFPIELSDMKDFRKVLSGPDPLENISVESGHLRHALEKELKGKLILLRGHYVASAGDAKALSRVMTASLPSMMVLCRAALRLSSGSAPASKVEAAGELGRVLGFDVSSFSEIAELRAGGKKPVDPEELFVRYLSAVEVLCTAVDGWVR